MSKVCILDAILEDYQAEEMALDCKCESADAAAKEWFAQTYADSDYRFDEKPTHSRYVCEIEGEWELWYDYGACYYFAINETITEEDEE